jgi:hypothetical protein
MPRKPPQGPPLRQRARRRRSGSAAARRLLRLAPRLRVVRRQHTLVYGLRLLTDRVLEDGPHDQLPLPRAGEGETLTLHQIAGDKEEIRRRLRESIDAYFDIFGEELD